MAMTKTSIQLLCFLVGFGRPWLNSRRIHFLTECS